MAGYQAYPYAQRENPRKTRIIAAKGQKWSGWPEGAMEFWRLLAKMLAFAQDRANNALGLGAQVLIASTACSGSLPGPLRAATPPAADRPRISTSR